MIAALNSHRFCLNRIRRAELWSGTVALVSHLQKVIFGFVMELGRLLVFDRLGYSVSVWVVFLSITNRSLAFILSEHLADETLVPLYLHNALVIKRHDSCLHRLFVTLRNLGQGLNLCKTV